MDMTWLASEAKQIHGLFANLFYSIILSLLLLGVVTAHAVGRKDRLHVADEIDLAGDDGGTRRRGSIAEQGEQEEAEGGTHGGGLRRGVLRSIAPAGGGRKGWTRHAPRG